MPATRTAPPLAADVFRLAERTGERITLGGVQRRLAELGSTARPLHVFQLAARRQRLAAATSSPRVDQRIRALRAGGATMAEIVAAVGCPLGTVVRALGR